MTFQTVYADTIEQKSSFLRLPKGFTTDPVLKKLSNDSKFLYMLLLDRLSLSKANNWTDSTGRVYIYYTIEEACEMLGKSHATVVRLMAELDEVKGVGLIQRKRQGLGKPDIIYVKYISETVEKEKKVSKKVDVSVGESEKFCVKNEISRSIKSTIPEVPKVEAIKTDKNNPEMINSLPPSNPPKNKLFMKKDKRERGEREYKVSRKQNPQGNPTLPSDCLENGERIDIAQVAQELQRDQVLPSNYLGNREKTGIAIEILTDLEGERLKFQHGEISEFDLRLHTLFCDVLTQMLTTQGTQLAKGISFSQRNIYEKVQKNLEMSGSPVNLYDFAGNTIQDYKRGAEQAEIRHPFSYMKSCILSALQSGNLSQHGEYVRQVEQGMSGSAVVQGYSSEAFQRR
ncbi:MAG: replication initiator protein A [Eubacteriales bacterium]